MKKLLVISVLSNIGLLAYLIWTDTVHRPDTVATDSSARSLDSLQAPRSTPPNYSNAPAATTPVGPFRWSQIESADYRVYIKNLRAIGCPEQTIRDIITADVESLYKARTRQLEKNLLALDGGPLSARLISRPQLEAQLKSLPREKRDLLAALLGGQPEATAEEASAPIVADGRQSDEEQPIVMPLVFANVDLSALHLEDSQMRVIGSLRHRFTDLVGGPDQNPNDPEYLNRWLKAQPEVDNWLRGMIGINTYQQFDLAARMSRNK